MMDKLRIDGREIAIKRIEDKDYISLSDMVRDDGGNTRIQNWMRNRDTIDFLTAWEELYNPNFNSVQMHRITEDAGRNRFTISPKQWIEGTGAIGIVSKAGRYGGTYAHKDIATNFGMWLSPRFSLLLIREFDRLREYARSQTRRSWDLRRELSKLNYQLHTDSIKEHIIPRIQHFQIQIPDWSIYAAEADLINLAAFGMTAKQWRETNPDLATRGNIRDFADHDQLHVLLNLESLNSALIEQGLDKDRRFSILSQHSLSQYRRLAENNNLKRLE